jgi:hypothetical protein
VSAAPVLSGRQISAVTAWNKNSALQLPIARDNPCTNQVSESGDEFSGPSLYQPRKIMPRWLITIFILIAAGVLLGILLTRAQAFAAPEQPIDYSHKTHVDAGIACLYCHSSALRSSQAGVPSVQKCIGCHNVIATDSPTVQEVLGYWERAEPIPWVKVNRQPEFVYFSHQPHLGAGLNCETCHGDVGGMGAVRPVARMDMGWCLDCHLEQPEEKVALLADCLICHK